MLHAEQLGLQKQQLVAVQHRERPCCLILCVASVIRPCTPGGFMDGWVDGWMRRWMGECMDG